MVLSKSRYFDPISLYRFCFQAFCRSFSFIPFFFILLFFILNLTSCSKPTPRSWEFDEIVTPTPAFNGRRIVLGPDSDFSNLELEIMKNSSGVRFYLNLLSFQAIPWKEDSSRSTVIIHFKEAPSWTVHPYLLEGGQRLLLPGNIADILIESLLNEQQFTIQLGRYQIEVVSINFPKYYQLLNNS